MSGVGKVKNSFTDLKKFQDKMNKFSENEKNLFLEACAKELAARLLAKVIKRTPVGQYDKPVSFTTSEGKQVSFNPQTGKKGGTLRRGWTAGKNSSASSYANQLQVNHFGGIYVIEIVNPTEYAPYVEFGHRTKNHKGWVRGKFMLTISEQEVEAAAPAILERKLMKKLGECFG